MDRESAPSGQLMRLNDILFEQMGRLTSGELAGDELKGEIERSKAVSNLARDVISNANTIVHAAIMAQGSRGGSGWKAVRTLAGPGQVPLMPREARMLDEAIPWEAADAEGPGRAGEAARDA